MESPEDEEPVPKRQRRLGPRLCPPVPSPPSPLLVSIGQDLATRCTITTGLPWRMKCDHTGACSSAVPNIARGIASCWPVWRGCSTATACKNATHPIFGGIRRPFCPGDHWKTPHLLFFHPLVAWVRAWCAVCTGRWGMISPTMTAGWWRRLRSGSLAVRASSTACPTASSVISPSVCTLSIYDNIVGRGQMLFGWFP